MPRAVVTGAAGFIGSHVAHDLLARGWEVVGFDNLSSGELANIDGLDDRFSLTVRDVSEGFAARRPVDAVLHLASPASPSHYLDDPLGTLRVGSIGTMHALELAREHGARFLLASSSEVYGEPLLHPQPESYAGNVSTIGPRAVYNEAKRFAETLAMTYHREYGVDVKIARLFNVYGPRLRPQDGRVVSNFLLQATTGRPLTIYGDGTQTRSFCFVDDTVDGLVAFLESDWVGPMNLGNPDECTILELATLVTELVGSPDDLVFEPLPAGDPTRRCPDTSLARRILGWSPEISLRDGLVRTHEWFVTTLADQGVRL